MRPISAIALKNQVKMRYTRHNLVQRSHSSAVEQLSWASTTNC